MAAEPETVVDPREAAESAGLRHVSDERPGIGRRRAGKGFAYTRPDGSPLSDKAQIERIRKLAIPPAYTDVWISPHANGHIQATGRDAKGRKQYRYHPDFRAVRESTKFEHVMAFAEALPGIRRTVSKHMSGRGLTRERVLATVVHLLEATLIRVGNDDYARTNRSYGLTTLRDPHVKVSGGELRFHFRGKSGKDWDVTMQDRRVARIVKACQDLPGQELFQYLDEEGARRDVTSADVNDYLREISGQDFTAKDFRTWAGTVLAGLALREFEAFDSEAVAKKNVRDAIERVAARLGNTPTICRKCYVHPELLDCYLAGDLLLEVKEAAEATLREDLGSLRAEEAAVLTLLRSRLRRETASRSARGKKAGAGGAKGAAKKTAGDKPGARVKRAITTRRAA